MSERDSVRAQLEILTDSLGQDGPVDLEEAWRELVSRAEAAETEAGQLTQNIEELQEDLSALQEANDDATEVVAELEALRGENEDLTGRMQNILNRGGLDLPPCWPKPKEESEIGAAEYTFDVVLYVNGFVAVSQSVDMPSYRLDAYLGLPNIPRITERILSLREFEELAKPIYDKGQDNQCVYYVNVEFESDEACRFLITVGEYFYYWVPPSERRECRATSA